MSKIRLIGTIGGTLACALGIGFFMQRGDTVSQPAVTPRAAAPVEQKTLPPASPSDLSMDDRLELKDIVLTSAQPEFPKSLTHRRPRLVDPAPHDLAAPLDDLTLPATPDDPDAPELGCDISASAEPAPMASVSLSIVAPCMPNERLTVHHNGMMFTAVSDENGSVRAVVPALSEHPILIADFGNGKGAVATASVPDLGDYDRVVLQWGGDNGFQIHAREFGAGYGDPGHVWAGSQAHPGGGSVVRLGVFDTLAPKLAEIYTFPARDSAKAGTVLLTVETEVTAQNCGRDITAQTLELREGSPLQTRDVSLAMPNCTAIGDFLVLNNLVDDLKIAAK